MRIGLQCRGRGRAALGAPSDSELVQDVLAKEDGGRSAFLGFLDPKNFLAGGVDALSETGMVPGEHEFEQLGGARGEGVDLDLGRGV